MLVSLLRFSYCALPASAVAEFPAVGVPGSSLALPYCLAALCRYAYASRAVWRPLFELLRRVAVDSLPMVLALNGHLSLKRGRPPRSLLI